MHLFTLNLLLSCPSLSGELHVVLALFLSPSILLLLFIFVFYPPCFADVSLHSQPATVVVVICTPRSQLICLFVHPFYSSCRVSPWSSTLPTSSSCCCPSSSSALPALPIYLFVRPRYSLSRSSLSKLPVLLICPFAPSCLSFGRRCLLPPSCSADLFHLRWSSFN